MKQNAKWEKESPYNFCDRWCEQCEDEKQKRCKIYQDEFEQKITCIAYGREPDDSEITAEVMQRQYESVKDVFEEYEEEVDINFETIDEPEFEKIKEHIKFVQNNHLEVTVEQYRMRTYAFLAETFYNDEKVISGLKYYFKTVSWYHTLLPIKVNRALAGFHEPAVPEDMALYDAVAQFQICQKAAKESIVALRKIKDGFPGRHKQIIELIALLHNIHSRIEALLETL